MQIAYLVVPFERIGTRVGARQAMIVDAPNKAQQLAQNLARKVPGVAVLERKLDRSGRRAGAHRGATDPSADVRSRSTQWRSLVLGS